MKKSTSNSNSKLRSLLSSVATEVGYHKTSLPGVSVARAISASKRHPVIYEPSIVVVAQGQKRGYIGDTVYTYDQNNYLVLSVPLPFECEYDASPTEPMLVITIDVTPSMVSDILLEIDDESNNLTEIPRTIYASPLEPTIKEPIERLLACILSPRDAAVLGRQIIREIVYRVLCGPQGHNLRALAHRDDSFSRIARVLKYIHQEYATEITVDQLARKASMSGSLFHQNFKRMTSTSPLQYIKQIRLHKARALMMYNGVNASNAALQVGYESASQFSREFRRMFGMSPSEGARQSEQT